jgi:hypothetical protein
MTRFIAASLFLLGLAACEARSPLMIESSHSAATLGEAAGGGCSARARSDWKSMKAEAAASGPTCEHAVVTLTVRAADGAPKLAWIGLARDIFGVADATDVPAMRTALADWIDQSRTSIRSTADLPAWDTTDGQSARAEFPFMPSEGLDAVSYEWLRQQKLDVFCFPQGRESLACATLQDGEMQPIGLQLFPG